MTNSDDFEVIRATDKSVAITFTDANGDPVDLTGVTIFFTVKNRSDLDESDDDLAVIKVDIASPHTDPTGGIATLVLTDTQTDIAPGDYVYDIKLKGSTGLISSASKGNFVVLENVGKRTSV